MLCFPGMLQAQGFGVYEQGTCAMGRAGATVAQPCNSATAMFFNPAGVAATPGITFSGGMTVVHAVGGFADDETGLTTELQNDPIPVPHAYVQYGVDERLGVGLGVFVPYGLGTEWPVEGFEGRFLGYDNQLESIYIQPTVAYQLTDRLALGAGLDIVRGSVALNQRVVDLSQQLALGGNTPTPEDDVTFGQLGIPRGTELADANLEGSGTGFGGHVGVLFDANEWLSLGARFLAPVTIEYEGTALFRPASGVILPPNNPIAQNDPDIPNDEPLPIDQLVAGQFAPGATFEDQSVSTEITLPAQFVGGVAVQATPQLQVLIDYQWTGWSSFDRLPLDFEHDALDTEQVEDYEDTHAVRLGAEYAVSDAFMVRAGFLTHGPAAPDQTVTPLLPEAYRNEFTVGVGWQLSGDVQLDAAYQYIDQNDRRGRVTELEGDTFDPDQDNDGLFSFGAHLFAATATIRL